MSDVDPQSLVAKAHASSSMVRLDLASHVTVSSPYHWTEPSRHIWAEESRWVRIPLKVGSDSNLNPVTDSEVKPGVFGAQRRWPCYRA